MLDQNKTKEQLIEELTELRKRVTELEVMECNHKQMEESLAEKSTYLDNILRSATEYSIATTDMDFRVTYYNPMAEKLFGYTAAEVIGKRVQDVHIMENVAKERLEQAIENVRNYGEHRYMFVKEKSDGIHHISSRVSGIYDTKKQLIGFALFSQDITAKKKVEEEIRRRNSELALFNHVIAASTAGLEIEAILETVCRELAIIFNISDVAAILLNESKTEAKVVAEYFGESQTTRQEYITNVEDNPALKYLLVHKIPLCVDGPHQDSQLKEIITLMHQRDIASILFLPLIIDEDVVGCLGLHSTEPRYFSTNEINLAWSIADQLSGALARERLTKKSQLLNTAIEQSAENVMITDTDGFIIYVNPAFEHITGYSKDEAIGKTPGALLKSGKLDKAFYKELWATISSGKVWHGRFINQKKDGTMYTEDATITPVRDENGEIINYVAAKRDITRELQMEEQYRQSQKMEAVGRFAGGIAHDFNNLLTAIMSYVGLTLVTLSPDHPVYNDIVGIQKTSERAANLIRQLLTFSRHQVIAPQTIDLNNIIINIDKMLGRLINKNIKLVTILTPNPVYITADYSQIDQILVNLVANARDAMPTGGVLTIKTTNVTFDWDNARQYTDIKPGDYVMLSVSDTGMGMTEEVKSHIFEPFFTTKDTDKGTGFGLATCFGIIKQSKGHIWVNSELGQGTTFELYFPLIIKETVKPEFDSGNSIEESKVAETILLVEDEPSVRKLACRILRDYGYTVLDATDGDDALRLSNEQSEKEIHLLITDVVMPNIDGKELTVQLRNIRPNIKILFISGYARTAVADYGVLDSDVSFLQKPFSAEALIQKVRETLGLI